MNPSDFLEIITKKRSGSPAFRLATIPPGYSSGRPTLIFDGQTTPTVKTYPYLSRYTPAANDRVLVAMVGRSGVIIDKII